MVKFCTVDDVKDFVAEDNIPTYITDAMIESWIIQASVLVNKVTTVDWSACSFPLDATPATPDDCELIREATYLLVSAKLVKRGGIDKLNNTGIAASGNVKKYSLGALMVERDVTSETTTSGEGTKIIYDMLLAEADRIVVLYGGSVIGGTVWASASNVDADNAMDSMADHLHRYARFMNNDTEWQ